MILTHGANSLARGGGGVTPPEGYELIQGVYGSCYCWDAVGNVFKDGNLYEYQTVNIGGREYPATVGATLRLVKDAT